MTKQVHPGIYQGVLFAPPSKSVSQRALILSMFAKGKSNIKNFGSSTDELTLLSAIKKCGAKVEYVKPNELVVEGLSSLDFSQHISIEESGLAFRLLIPCLALSTRVNTIEALGSLQNRPMQFYLEIL